MSSAHPGDRCLDGDQVVACRHVAREDIAAPRDFDAGDSLVGDDAEQMTASRGPCLLTS